MQYGIIDTTAMNTAWVQAYGLDDVTVAVAMAMPALAHGGRGVTAKRGGLRAPGFGTFYLATRLHAALNPDRPATDAAYTAACGSTSNKTVYLSDLVAAGLVKVSGKPRTGQVVTLTDAGVAQVKAVNGELGKLAKAYTETAYTKAAKAIAKAAKAAERGVELAQAELDAIAGDQVEAGNGEAETPEVVVTADQVEADQQAQHEADQH